MWMSFVSGAGCGFNQPSPEKPQRTASPAALGECKSLASASSGMGISLAILSHPSTRMGQKYYPESEAAATRIVSNQAMWHNRKEPKGN